MNINLFLTDLNRRAIQVANVNLSQYKNNAVSNKCHHQFDSALRRITKCATRDSLWAWQSGNGKYTGSGSTGLVRCCWVGMEWTVFRLFVLFSSFHSSDLFSQTVILLLPNFPKNINSPSALLSFSQFLNPRCYESNKSKWISFRNSLDF